MPTLVGPPMPTLVGPPLPTLVGLGADPVTVTDTVVKPLAYAAIGAAVLGAGGGYGGYRLSGRHWWGTLIGAVVGGGIGWLVGGAVGVRSSMEDLTPTTVTPPTSIPY